MLALNNPSNQLESPSASSPSSAALRSRRSMTHLLLTLASDSTTAYISKAAPSRASSRSFAAIRRRDIHQGSGAGLVRPRQLSGDSSRTGAIAAGGIAPLIRLLRSPSAQAQAYAACVLADLTCHWPTTRQAAREGGIEPLVRLLSSEKGGERRRKGRGGGAVEQRRVATRRPRRRSTPARSTRSSR